MPGLRQMWDMCANFMVPSPQRLLLYRRGLARNIWVVSHQQGGAPLAMGSMAAAGAMATFGIFVTMPQACRIR